MSEWQINECKLYIRNDYPLMVNLDFDFYNNFAKKKMAGKYDRELALKALVNYFIPVAIRKYARDTDSRDLYGMTAKEKKEVANYLLTLMEEEGGHALSNPPLNSITGKIELRKELTPSQSKIRAEIMRAHQTCAPKTYIKNTSKKNCKFPKLNVRGMF